MDVSGVGPRTSLRVSGSVIVGTFPGGEGGCSGEGVVERSAHLDVSYQIDPFHTPRTLHTLSSHSSFSQQFLLSNGKIDLF